MLRTEREILLAFNRLITHTEMEKITTQMIADEAGIGRATFYRYYKDKYDVLNRNYKELLDSCAGRCDNYRDLFCQLFCHAREEWSGFHRAFYTTGINSFKAYISAYSRSVVERITALDRGGRGLSAAEAMQLDVFCCGIGAMYEKWTLGQYALEPDAAADALYAIMPETLRLRWHPSESGKRPDGAPLPLS